MHRTIARANILVTFGITPNCADLPLLKRLETAVVSVQPRVLRELAAERGRIYRWLTVAAHLPVTTWLRNEPFSPGFGQGWR
jgi:hypothetical protein